MGCVASPQGMAIFQATEKVKKPVGVFQAKRRVTVLQTKPGEEETDMTGYVSEEVRLCCKPMEHPLCFKPKCVASPERSGCI